MGERELAIDARNLKFTGGLPETPCGAGSTLRTTEHLRRELPLLLRSLGVTMLVDAPCGDGNWMRRTDLTGVAYLGVDSSEDNLALARSPSEKGCEPRSRCFVRADLRAHPFGRTDAVLCRDFFQHLATEDVLELLERVRKSEAVWLLATSFDNVANEELGPDGFRPLNLELEPFNLGKPTARIEDPPGSGRILGAWEL